MSSPLSNGSSNGDSSPLNDNGHVRDTSPLLHRVATVRLRQGVSLRTVARQWNLDVDEVRRLEDESADLSLSQLYAWQELLEVPINELFIDSYLPLSAPIKLRAQLLRLMKTAVTLQRKSTKPAVGRLVDMLVEELVDIMPELASVGPWHNPDGSSMPSDELPKIFQLPEDDELDA